MRGRKSPARISNPGSRSSRLRPPGERDCSRGSRGGRAPAGAPRSRRESESAQASCAARSAAESGAASNMSKTASRASSSSRRKNAASKGRLIPGSGIAARVAARPRTPREPARSFRPATPRGARRDRFARGPRRGGCPPVVGDEAGTRRRSGARSAPRPSAAASRISSAQIHDAQDASAAGQRQAEIPPPAHVSRQDLDRGRLGPVPRASAARPPNSAGITGGVESLGLSVDGKTGRARSETALLCLSTLNSQHPYEVDLACVRRIFLIWTGVFGRSFAPRGWPRSCRRRPFRRRLRRTPSTGCRGTPSP